MSSVSVLLELEEPRPEAFSAFAVAVESESDAVEMTESLLDRVAAHGVEIEEEHIPIPMFSTVEQPQPLAALGRFAQPQSNPDMTAPTSVVAARVPAGRLDALAQEAGVQVWPNSELALFPSVVDCQPFQPPVTVERIQELLDVHQIWDQGHRGEAIVVGIIDEGLNGETYPVQGGFVGPGAPEPGSAPVTSHGSMCAADVLIAAPDAVLYDYPFLGVPRSGGALAMFQAVLDQRRRDGTPHLTNNSYGFYDVPPKEQFPTHEIWDENHPVHRKVREVIASGAPAFFAAGNCGADCPAGNCSASSIGPGNSIHASNSLAEVITVAAVNSAGTRLGYSSQGPGMFQHEKPDLAAYSHMLGNFGPGRPGGVSHAPFDNGTSAASPLACGVGALLLSARPGASPADLKSALVAGSQSSGGGGWSPEVGAGVLDAGAAFAAFTSSSS